VETKVLAHLLITVEEDGKLGVTELWQNGQAVYFNPKTPRTVAPFPTMCRISPFEASVCYTEIPLSLSKLPELLAFVCNMFVFVYIIRLAYSNCSLIFITTVNNLYFYLGYVAACG